jgi:hypothetical protein
MNPALTPFQIRFMLEFASAGSGAMINIHSDQYDSAVGKETRAWLQAEGLIHDGHNGTKWGDPTDRLLAYVEHLCAQPLPKIRWVIE